MKQSLILCIFFIFIYTVPATAAEFYPCGSFKAVSGTVTIQRLQKEITATRGARIYPQDRIISADDGTASLILEDNTVICVGPDSTMDIETFLFNPSVYEYSLVTRVVKGSFLFLSGIIAKLAPDNVKVNTPDGTIAIRGTKFLVEVLP